jgi:ABC-type branched-subunit amino acid transport system ATPase component
VTVPALSTSGLNKSFGSLVVASDIAITLPQGERYALIGPNGAGKTTLINLMTGMLAPDSGRIRLGDLDITRMTPQQRVKPSRSTRCFPNSARLKRSRSRSANAAATPAPGGASCRPMAAPSRKPMPS